MRALHEPARAHRLGASRPHHQGSQRLASGRLARPGQPPRSAKAASPRPHGRIAKAANGFAKPDRERSQHSPSIVTPRPPAASPNVRAHALADCAMRPSPASALLLVKI